MYDYSILAPHNKHRQRCSNPCPVTLARFRVVGMGSQRQPRLHGTRLRDRHVALPACSLRDCWVPGCGMGANEDVGGKTTSPPTISPVLETYSRTARAHGLGTTPTRRYLKRLVACIARRLPFSGGTISTRSGSDWRRARHYVGKARIKPSRVGFITGPHRGTPGASECRLSILASPVSGREVVRKGLERWEKFACACVSSLLMNYTE